MKLWKKKEEISEPDFDSLLRVATPGDMVYFTEPGEYCGTQKLYGQFEKATIINDKVTGCLIYLYTDKYLSSTKHSFCPIDRILSISQGAGEIIRLRELAGKDFQKLGVIRFERDI